MEDYANILNIDIIVVASQAAVRLWVRVLHRETSQGPDQMILRTSRDSSIV